MQCEIRTGVCNVVVTTYVYRAFGRYAACKQCAEEVERSLAEPVGVRLVRLNIAQPITPHSYIELEENSNGQQQR